MEFSFKELIQQKKELLSSLSQIETYMTESLNNEISTYLNDLKLSFETKENIFILKTSEYRIIIEIKSSEVIFDVKTNNTIKVKKVSNLVSDVAQEKSEIAIRTQETRRRTSISKKLPFFSNKITWNPNEISLSDFFSENIPFLPTSKSQEAIKSLQ